MTIFKYDHGYYWKLTGGLRARWENSVGAYHEVERNIAHLEFYVGSPEAFEKENTARRLMEDILLENLVYGWIDADGNYLSCSHGKHYNLAYEGLDKGYEFDDENWIHLSGRGWFQTNSTFVVTEAQRKTLRQIGRNPHSSSQPDKKLTYEQAFPDGNPAMDRLITECEDIIAQGESKRKSVFFASRAELLKHAL